MEGFRKHGDFDLGLQHDLVPTIIEPITNKSEWFES